MTKIGGNNIFINDFHLSQKCRVQFTITIGLIQK